MPLQIPILTSKAISEDIVVSHGNKNPLILSAGQQRHRSEPDGIRHGLAVVVHDIAKLMNRLMSSSGTVCHDGIQTVSSIPISSTDLVVSRTNLSLDYYHGWVEILVKHYNCIDVVKEVRRAHIF